MSRALKVAIVTGAAGGVGRAVLKKLVDDGYAVVAEDLAPEVGDLQLPGRVVPLRADVGAADSGSAAVRVAVAEFGRLDLLVNNAARFLARSVELTTVDDWDQLMSINARGAFLHAKFALPDLVRTKGAIVNVCSISGLVGLQNQAVYSASKGALVQLTRQLAIEYAAVGVRINAVAPGAIDTDFAADAQRDDPDPEARAARIRQMHPIGRISTPAEVANAICFLASATGISGAILSVDGGFVAG